MFEIQHIDESGCWLATGKLPREELPEVNLSILLGELETELSQKELDFFGRKVLVPRLTAWFGSKSYDYSGIKNDPRPIPPMVSQVALWLNRNSEGLPGAHGQETFNSVLCNYYRSGMDSIDWHSDNEKGLGPDPASNILIGSVTFGGSRKFVLKNKTSKEKLSFDLGDRDVLIMGGLTQKFWVHKSPRVSGRCEPRLNLTFRVSV